MFGSRAQLGGEGINVFGFFKGQFGLAESARLYTRALIECGVPVAVNNIEIDQPHQDGDTDFDEFLIDDAPYPTTIVFANPDHFLDPSFKKVLKKIQGTRVIGSWFWELEDVPQAWLPALDMVDGLLVASRFIEAAFRKVTDKPITRVPIPLPVGRPDSGLQRNDFGLPKDKYIFLTTFDFSSSLERKNPFGTIAAFKQAFPERNDVRLLIKSSNGFRHPLELQELINIAAEDHRIIFVDQVVDSAHLRSLQRCCDVYVSLHRSEGFGLGIAECMLLGKPVIATGWSGNTDLTTNGASNVDYVLVPVGGRYQGGNSDRWAEPCLKDASRKMCMAVRGQLPPAALHMPQDEVIERILSAAAVVGTP
ncbi:Glycosyl transferases group 1 [Lysobacter silvestris]|uniref:Glycosyl transferases group 1 n=1 Tax=Solilutibacter silvestris TaxID=1645665 RepID=A0A2K1Q2E6_9GAMM|nr:Glycosyl transferases group 1 [Lysobacter silvestris]